MDEPGVSKSTGALSPQPMGASSALLIQLLTDKQFAHLHSPDALLPSPANIRQYNFIALVDPKGDSLSERLRTM